jgi:hypothetical protein
MYTIDSTHGLNAVADTARDAVGVLGRHLAEHRRAGDVTFLGRDCDGDRWVCGTSSKTKVPAKVSPSFSTRNSAASCGI